MPMVPAPVTPALYRQPASTSTPLSHMGLKVNTEMDSEVLSFDDGLDTFPFREKPNMETLVLVQSSSWEQHQHKVVATEQRKLVEELTAFAMSSMRSSNLDVAEEIFRHVLYLQNKSTGGSDDGEERMLATLANIGKCCEWTGRLQEAMSCYKEALQLKSHQELRQESRSVQLLLASILYDIGMIHSKVFLGSNSNPNSNEQAQKAVQSFSLSLQLRQSCFGEQHQAVASVQHNIAILLTTAQFPALAIDYHKKALATRRITLGNLHPEVASSLRHLATAHKALGNYQEAAGFLSEALEILRFVPYEGFLQEVMIELSHVKRALQR